LKSRLKFKPQPSVQFIHLPTQVSCSELVPVGCFTLRKELSEQCLRYMHVVVRSVLPHVCTLIREGCSRVAYKSLTRSEELSREANILLTRS